MNNNIKLLNTLCIDVKQVALEKILSVMCAQVSYIHLKVGRIRSNLNSCGLRESSFIFLFVSFLLFSLTVGATENNNQIFIESNSHNKSEKRVHVGDLYKTTYKGQVVYYISSVCCDIPARLLDKEGKLACYPNGGFISVDKACPDFVFDRTKSTKIEGLPRYITKKKKEQQNETR